MPSSLSYVQISWTQTCAEIWQWTFKIIGSIWTWNFINATQSKKKNFHVIFSPKTFLSIKTSLAQETMKNDQCAKGAFKKSKISYCLKWQIKFHCLKNNHKWYVLPNMSKLKLHQLKNRTKKFEIFVFSTLPCNIQLSE